MQQEGFSLIELMISLGLIAGLAALGMPVSFKLYSHYIFKSEAVSAVTLLKQARSQSFSNISNSSHGIRFEDGLIINFSPPYSPTSPTNQVVRLSRAKIVGHPQEIIFSKHSGFPEAEHVFQLTDDHETKKITVTQTGQITSE